MSILHLYAKDIQYVQKKRFGCMCSLKTGLAARLVIWEFSSTTASYGTCGYLPTCKCASLHHISFSGIR